MPDISMLPATAGTAVHPPDWVLAHNELVARIDVLEKRIEELESQREGREDA